MKPTTRWFGLCFGFLLLAACSPVQAPAAGAPPATAITTAEASMIEEEGALAPAAEGPSLPEAVASALASQLGVTPDALTVVSVEAVEWPDACLGVTRADEMCAQVITPGYRIVLEQDGQEVEYHTDLNGSAVRRAGEPQPALDRGDVELSLTHLMYRGPEEVRSEDTSRCASLSITFMEAQLTACDGVQTSLPLPENLAAIWSDFGARLASFDVETPSEQLSLLGSGENSAPEWQRALLAWARLTRAELASGQTSASARTALSWNLGLLPDAPDTCAHLTVLDFGYAYAEQRACEGGELVADVEGWLEQEEMAQFDAWLYGFGPVYVDDNYLNGVGEASMGEEEAAAVGPWAQALWTRLSGLPLAPVDASADSTGAAAGAAPAAAVPAGCSAPDGDVFESPVYGFCLVTPPGYAVVETEPGNFSLVAGGDITNHVDPRVSMEVSAAGDRTLAQVAEQLAADYAPAGETVEPQPVTVGGVQGVMLDNLPGQDLNRRLAFVHNGQVYSVQLTPLSPEAEPFFQAVLDSLRF